MKKSKRPTPITPPKVAPKAAPKAAPETPRALSFEEFLKKYSIDEREVNCPVRHAYKKKMNPNYKESETKVKEYLVPRKLFYKDKDTQPRKNGKDQDHISTLVDDMRANGQKHGVCARYDGENRLATRWGSHRLDGVEQLDKLNLSIKGAPQGYIWFNVYTFAESELLKLQTLENNIDDPKKIASTADNLDALNKASISSLDKVKSSPTEKDIIDVFACENADTDKLKIYKFEDMPEAEQREQLRNYIKDWMPAVGRTTRKVTNLIDSFYATESNPFKSDTLNKHQGIAIWNGSTGKELDIKILTPGGVATDKNGVTHKLYVTDDPNKGSTLKDALTSRRVWPHGKKLADVIHIVLTLPVKSLRSQTTMEEKRTKYTNILKDFSKILCKQNVVDHIYFPPQSTHEVEEVAKANADAKAEDPDILDNPWIRKEDL